MVTLFYEWNFDYTDGESLPFYEILNHISTPSQPSISTLNIHNDGRITITKCGLVTVLAQFGGIVMAITQHEKEGALKEQSSFGNGANQLFKKEV